VLASAPVSQISDGQPQGQTAVPVTQISDGQPQGPTGVPVTQKSDGQIVATSAGEVVSIKSEGQPVVTPVTTAPAAPPVSQGEDLINRRSLISS